MTHLTPQQFVEAMDRALSPEEVRHLKTCAPCQRELAELQAVLGDVRATTMPEPSPLFWDHFSQRVKEATSPDRMPAPRWWESAISPISTIGLALAAMALVFVVRIGPATPAGGSALVSDTLASANLGDDPANEQPWDLVTMMATDLPTGEGQLVTQPTSDGAAAMLGELSPAQRARLLQLIKAEMGRSE